MTEQAEREKWIEEKAKDIGISVEELKLIQEDDDLWILSLAEREVLTGEEAVRQWRQTSRFMRALADALCGTDMVSDATSQLLRDADYRAHTAYKRALQRVREAAAQDEPKGGEER